MRKRNMISKAAAMGLAVLTAASLTLTGCSQPAGDKETAQETQQTAQAAESETQAPEAAQTQAEAGQTTAAQAAGEAAKVENKTGKKIKVGYDIYFLGNSWSVQLYQEFKWSGESLQG